MYKHLYSKFFEAEPGRLHFSAHSHYPWPDVTHSAHNKYWEDSTRLADEKWAMLFSDFIPELQNRLATVLGTTKPKQLCFAPNTHEFIVRLLSCFERKPIRILTTDGEFYSFSRQTARLEECGDVEVTRVPVQPFDSFAERFNAAASEEFELVFLSHVFFETGFIVPDLKQILAPALVSDAVIVIDSYHSAGAIPVDYSELEERVFILGGSYKYLQSGEGACFLSVPTDFSLRPKNTGWFAAFGELYNAKAGVRFSNDGFMFFGATFDPSGLYRLNAVLEMFQQESLSAEVRDRYVGAVQQYVLAKAGSAGKLAFNDLLISNLSQCGHFLTFEREDADVQYKSLLKKRVITDKRNTRHRFGFGLYQTTEDIDELFERL